MPMRKAPKRPAPPWLHDSVYERKRQRTVTLVKQAVDALVKQREQDGTTRVSLTTIVTASRHVDPEGRGVAHTTILDNAEAYAYYKRYRTASSKPVKRHGRRHLPFTDDPTNDPIAANPALTRLSQRYMTWSRPELVRRLIAVEQECERLHEQWLDLNDQLLQWQLRTLEAEEQIAAIKRLENVKNAKDK